MHSNGPAHQKLAIVMVGLPARGKSYTARRIERYLSWLGYKTRVFNVGQYRRARVGAQVPHGFFDPHNPEGAEARRLVAIEALDDMLDWLGGNGHVGIYDATNSNVERRVLVRTRCEQAGLQVLFVEMQCDDPAIVENNIRATKLSSPDYENVDEKSAVDDFRRRIEHYIQAYQPVCESEGAYLRVSGAGRNITVSQVDGYLHGRLVFFLMNLHLVDRPILLTRHGESMYNVVDRIGGDSDLSPDGQRYARALAGFIDERFPDHSGLAIWTSSLRRALRTASILGRHSMPWRALDEINAGICDGMTYEQIKEAMPNEFTARSRDKFRYRYPRGESYEDVIARLDTVIIELERTRQPVLVVAHQAVLRAIYAYFHNIPPEQCTRLQIPLHTVIHLQPHAYGCEEERIPLSV